VRWPTSARQDSTVRAHARSAGESIRRSTSVAKSACCRQEGSGLSVRPSPRRPRVRIPLAPGVDSLNVARLRPSRAIWPDGPRCRDGGCRAAGSRHRIATGVVYGLVGLGFTLCLPADAVSTPSRTGTSSWCSVVGVLAVIGSTPVARAPGLRLGRARAADPRCGRALSEQTYVVAASLPRWCGWSPAECVWWRAESPRPWQSGRVGLAFSSRRTPCPTPHSRHSDRARHAWFRCARSASWLSGSWLRHRAGTSSWRGRLGLPLRAASDDPENRRACSRSVERVVSVGVPRGRYYWPAWRNAAAPGRSLSVDAGVVLGLRGDAALLGRLGSLRGALDRWRGASECSSPDVVAWSTSCGRTPMMSTRPSRSWLLALRPEGCAVALRSPSYDRRRPADLCICSPRSASAVGAEPSCHPRQSGVRGGGRFRHALLANMAARWRCVALSVLIAAVALSAGRGGRDLHGATARPSDHGHSHGSCRRCWSRSRRFRRQPRLVRAAPARLISPSLVSASPETTSIWSSHQCSARRPGGLYRVDRAPWARPGGDAEGPALAASLGVRSAPVATSHRHGGQIGALGGAGSAVLLGTVAPAESGRFCRCSYSGLCLAGGSPYGVVAGFGGHRRAAATRGRDRFGRERTCRTGPGSTYRGSARARPAARGSIPVPEWALCHGPAAQLQPSLPSRCRRDTRRTV